METKQSLALVPSEKTSTSTETNGEEHHTRISVETSSLTEVTDEVTIQEPSAPACSSSDIVKWIIGLRGFSVCLVLCHHVGDLVHGFTAKNMEREAYWLPFELFLRGVSVGAFFVLSGFSLSLKYYRKFPDVGEAGKVLASSSFRRWFRLYLPSLVAGLVSYIFYETGAYSPSVQILRWKESLGTVPGIDLEWFYRGMPASRLADTTYSERVLIFLEDMTYKMWIPFYFSPYNSALWTMAVELLGSVIMLWALLALILVRPWVRRGIFLVLCLVGLGAPTPLAKFIAEFFAGSLFADAWVNSPPKPSLSVWRNRFYLVGVWMLFIFSYYLLDAPEPIPLVDRRFTWLNKLLEPFQTSTTSHYLGSVLVVYSIQLNPQLQAFFASKFMIFVGRISIGLYLLHYSFFYSIVCWVYLYIKTWPSWGIYFTLLPILFLVTGIAAYFFARFVDEPFSILVRKFEKRIAHH